MNSAPSASMYLVLPVPFRIADGKTLVEAQAANGLDRWADHFAKVVVAAPVIPESEVRNLAGFVWRDIATLEHRARIECQPLPWAYTPGPFFKHLGATRGLIGQTIARCEHLQFAIGGLIGDWAAVAALEATKQKRRYALHTDRVEHELIRKTASSASLKQRLKIAVEAPLMKRYHRRIIRRCALGLWHGDDCFRAYSPWCTENHLIHDIHTKQADLIDAATLAAKLENIRTAETLNIVYAGRLDPMKAPLEWLRAIATANDDYGVNLSATWYGEGALRDQALAAATRLDIDDVVSFPGFVASRPELLHRLREAHMLVFTHITAESPRILLEALVSGTPIVGYDNPYAVNLLEAKGGGVLVPIHDTQTLGAVIAALAGDRRRLASMTQEAANNGRRFTDAAVFAERSALIKKYA
jgi:glycosyltransferase involved in cell wall biosynthesis